MMRSAFAPALLAVFLLSLPACAAAPNKKPIKLGAVDTGPGSLTQARKYLEGQWTLESFEIRPPGRPSVTPKATGLLTYDDFGNLTMEIRVDQATSDLLRTMGLDLRDGAISSSGRTAVDMQKRSLTYVLEGQQAPGAGPLAMNRPRYWQVEGDILTLTTKDDAGNPASIGRWRKINK
jgi:hypothetical protein